jgi:hypothetical protein
MNAENSEAEESLYSYPMSLICCIVVCISVVLSYLGILQRHRGRQEAAADRESPTCLFPNTADKSSRE